MKWRRAIVVVLGLALQLGIDAAEAASSQSASENASEASTIAGTSLAASSQAFYETSALVVGNVTTFRQALSQAAVEYREKYGSVGTISSVGLDVSALPVMIVESVTALSTEAVRLVMRSVQGGAVLVFDFLTDEVGMPVARGTDRVLHISGQAIRTGGYFVLAVTDAGVVLARDFGSASKLGSSGEFQASSQIILGSLGNMGDAYGTRMARRHRKRSEGVNKQSELKE